MDQIEYRQRKDSGETVDDADLQQEEIEEEYEEVEQEEVEGTEEVEEEETEEIEEADELDDLPPLPAKEQTAFKKRMERERTKLEEKLKAELEQKYSRHQQVIEMLGGDPDAIEKRIRDNNIAAEAQHMADANGWDSEQTEYYIEQQRQKREHEDLKVQMQIYKLKDNPDYAGITALEPEIKRKIEQTKGLLSVEEAFWAIGGHKRAEQIKLEAQVRESTKRQKQTRTVLTDSQTSASTEKPLPSEIARQAASMGISAAEARRLMGKNPAKNIDEWRAQRKAK